MIFAPGFMMELDSMPKVLRPVILWVMVHISWASRPSTTSASATLVVMGSPTAAHIKDAREGKFMRRRWSCTRHCRSSASSTSRSMPLGVRAQRPATITGFSAASSSFAASLTAAASPWGGALSASFGMRRFFSVMGSSCSVPSATITTGS